MSVQKNKKLSRGLQLIAGGTLWADCPIGTINAYGGTTTPEGWLICQGQALSRTEYADLFAVIGTNFGSGDGSTTFNIPDLRGEFLRGAGTNQHTNQGSGSSVGAHQDSTEITPYYIAEGGSTEYLGVASDNFNIRLADSGYQAAGASNTVNNGAHTTKNVTRMTVRPTNTSVNYIIKSKQTPIPADLAAELENMAFAALLL